MRINRLNKYILNSKSRRRGQALLLSVLIMILVVLLGTTFIAIVASNMSNTARSGSKDEARQAAKAGIEYVDSQLTDSTEGLDWRPTVPTVPGNYYYTSFDRAQGWSQPFFTSQTGSASLASFVKYPNPQGTSPTGNTVNFMTRVSQVQAGDPDNADNTKTNDIRVESIGFADDDPAAYYEIVAYKNGPTSNPLTAAMRSVTNWDFVANTVPQGYFNVAGPGTTTVGPMVQLSSASGYFDNNACPFYVTVTTAGNLNNAVPPQMASVEVTGVTYVNGEPNLQISTPFTVGLNSPTATLQFQKAASLGAPLTVNFDNATSTPVDYRISGINNLSGTEINSPGSVWVNGGLVWFGTSPTTSGVAGFNGIHATNLIAPSAATAADPASTIKVSGLFTSNVLSSPATPAPTVQVSGTSSSGAVAETLPVDSTTMTSTDPLITSGLVNDGLNAIQGSSDPTRQVQPFTPPDITSGGDGFGRYRQLTKYSASTNASYPQAAAYGYGQGIYIDNPQDVEKAGTTAMTQANLQELWYGTGTANSFDRLGTPDAPSSLPSGTTGSLEGQHMRGWVSPDQFLPRGAEVIINSNNTITVNLDPMEDNSAAYPGANLANSPLTPDPAKGWSDVSGNLMGDGPSGTDTGGVYSQTFSWPADGTLFAEGNIRIRGTDTTAPSSLTVVSMNNIYIEGSLSAGTKKVLLLAKNNVIVNPTQVLEDVQAVTRLSAATVDGGTTVNVYDAANFRVGDFIQISGDTANTYQIQSISGTTMTLDSALGGTTGIGEPQLLNSVVTAVFDPRTDSSSYAAADSNKPYNTAIRLSQFTNVIQRRLQWPSATTNIRLAFRHSAEYRKALEIAIQSPVGTPPLGPDIVTASLTNKIQIGATSPQDIIQTADKALTVTYTENPAGSPSPGTDTFLNTLPADQPTAAGSTSTLNALVTQMIAQHPTTQWNYDPTKTVVDPNYTTTQTPYYFLASAGSRYPFNYLPSPTTGAASAYPPTSEPSEPIYPPPSSGVMNLPMATSVRLLMNNVQSSLELFPGLDIVNQFGFSPIFIDSTTPQNAAEDVLTSDQYFYQPHVFPAPPAPPYPSSDAANPGYFPGVPDSLTGNYATTYAGQNAYDSTDGTNVTQYTLDSRTLGQAPNDGTNEIALQLNNATVDSTATPATTVQYYFGTKTPLTASPDPSIPFYRLSSLKLENEGFDSSAPPNLNQVSPGAIFNINAYVYAQQGGWYVIAGPNFDQSNTTTDSNNVKNGQDLNRDGVISQGESAAAYRYHRYNYQIVFTGAIMENQTASPTDVGLWMDKWATVNLTSANFTGGAVVPDSSLTYDSSNPATSNFGDIVYYYDPTAAQGTLTADPGFHAPVAPGLIYQG